MELLRADINEKVEKITVKHTVQFLSAVDMYKAVECRRLLKIKCKDGQVKE